MATKRPDLGNDATMEVSTSQLVVPSTRPVLPRGRGNPGNDMSVWRQVVVGTDDFAPAPAATKRRPRARLLAIVGGVLALGGAGAAYALYARDASPPPAAPAAAPAPATAAPSPPPSAPAAAAGSAAIATPPPVAPAEAAAATPTIPTATPAIAATDPAAVDAISGVAPVIAKAKPAKRKRVTKRTATKKRTATTRTKR